MTPTRSKIDVPIYQIKVTLKDSKPPIWRRILLRSDTTLGQLHHILQNVMDWESYHLHQFIVGRTYYGEPHPDYGSDMRDESRVRLNQIVTGEKFQYRNKTINGTGIHSCLLALCCCSSGGPHSPTPTPPHPHTLPPHTHSADFVPMWYNNPHERRPPRRQGRTDLPGRGRQAVWI